MGAVAVARATRLPPGPPGDLILGSVRSLRRDPLAFFLQLATDYRDVSSFRAGPRRIVLASHPDAARHVLQEHAKRYDKQTRGFDALRLLLRNGLLTSEGPSWLRQRRLMQPAFHRQRIAGFATLFADAAGGLAAQLERHAGGTPVDVSAEIMRLTLRLASQTLFGTDVGEDAPRISRALTTSMRFANDRITSILDLPLSIPIPSNRRASEAKDTLDAVVAKVVRERRRVGNDGRTDLLSMLMEATDEETGERMNDEQLHDEVMTLLLAGHETTAAALTWTMVLLSRHPGVRRRLEEEVDTVLGGRLPTFEDVPKLALTRRVIDEAMRLYPPAWIISRRAIEDDELMGFHIPAGTIVVASPWVTHRTARCFDNPEGFDPDRFESARADAMPRFAYFPFGGGPRMCIGNTFALLEATLVLATLSSRVRLDLPPGATVEPEPAITLRPRDAVRMHVQRRR